MLSSVKVHQKRFIILVPNFPFVLHGPSQLQQKTLQVPVEQHRNIPTLRPSSQTLPFNCQQKMIQFKAQKILKKCHKITCTYNVN